MKKEKIKENILNALLSVFFLSVLVLAVVFFIDSKKWIGVVFVILGFIHLLVLKLFKIRTTSVLPDIIFGMIDNGFLIIGALVGAEFAGVFGAIVGGAAMNAITDGFAGIFEGWTAEHLRKKYKIKEQRTALSSAIGKMAGCFFGAGFVLIIAWTIFSL